MAEKLLAQLFGVDDISDTETSAVNAEIYDKFVNVLTQECDT
jgi:hypothetical protein